MIPMNRREFLGKTVRYGGTGLGLSAGAMLLQGFSFGDIGASLGKAGQYIESATKSFDAVSKALEDISPEQEYYIGRTVAALVLDKYKVWDRQDLIQYLNDLGQTLTRFSDLPELFDGYHFMALDSSDINAFATPSGIIFVTRGMLRCCSHEGALAAVLAHEIGHVQYKHGLQSIENDRITKATSILAMEGTKTFADSDIASLTSTFEDSINDIASSMINNGYSRAFENEADGMAVTIMKRVGYDPHGLIDMLTIMKKKLHPGGHDFAKTHPSPDSRIENINDIIGSAVGNGEVAARVDRFQKAMQGV